MEPCISLLALVTQPALGPILHRATPVPRQHRPSLSATLCLQSGSFCDDFSERSIIFLAVSVSATGTPKAQAVQNAPGNVCLLFFFFFLFLLVPPLSKLFYYTQTASVLFGLPGTSPAYKGPCLQILFLPLLPPTSLNQRKAYLPLRKYKTRLRQPKVLFQFHLLPRPRGFQC